jgi:arabinogalactan endo-1,4-beta-galactosidase
MKLPYLSKLLPACALCFMLIKSSAQNKEVEKIIGADISFLPQLEDQGEKFSIDGKTADAIAILKQQSFNWIRLRIFVNPEADSGYSPKKGYCNLDQTKKMAVRIKAQGMKFLLDFHYSDYWADPGKQFKPAAWRGLSFTDLTKTLHDYTKNVLTALKEQGTLPDMIQIGNEITHGMVWPDGNIIHLDSLATLLKAGISAAKEISPASKIMLHIDRGGENAESRFFVDNMLKRNVKFDVIGESYYPQWQGTLDSLKANLNDLSKRYKQDVIVAEYTQHKIEVNDIVFNLPNGKIKGAFIWEPLNTWENIFDKQGVAKDSLINIYPAIAKKYDVPENKIIP